MQNWKHFKNLNLASRYEFVVGDFFDKIRVNADIYLMKSIIHDWDDANAITILKNCRATMDNGARFGAQRPEVRVVSHSFSGLCLLIFVFSVISVAPW